MCGRRRLKPLLTLRMRHSLQAGEFAGSSWAPAQPLCTGGGKGPAELGQAPSGLILCWVVVTVACSGERGGARGGQWQKGSRGW